jgi:phosphatidyl-myo-inositol alpha-mannosyltransferase
MRVGMICPYSLTVSGGVQAQVLGLARVLRTRGVDVRVLAPCDGPPPENGITALGASLPTAANGSIAPIAPDLPAQVRLIKAIWNEEFELIHLHEPLAPGIGITTVLMQAAPMIGTFHAAGRSSAYRWANRACRALRRRLDIACAVSAEAEELAAEWLGGSYERVFNGIDVERFASASPTRSAVPAIFFIGRHEERKGLRVLLEAARRLPGDVEIWVAGQGDQTGELKRQFGHDRNVVWLGRISEEEKMARLAGASVVCAPSLGGESFGIVLLEAMAAGTPIVASRIPGYGKVARGGSDALLVAPGDVDSLRHALSLVLDGGADVDARVESGRSRADEFSMTALADIYIEKYERMLANKAKG